MAAEIKRTNRTKNDTFDVDDCYMALSELAALKSIGCDWDFDIIADMFFDRFWERFSLQNRSFWDRSSETVIL